MPWKGGPRPVPWRAGLGNCTDDTGDTGGPGQYIMLLKCGPAGYLIHELGPISVNGMGGQAWWITRTLGIGPAAVLLLASGPTPSLHTHGLIQMLPCIPVGPGGVFWCQEWADARQIDRVGLCEVHSRHGWAHVTPYPEIDEQGCNHGLLMSRDTIS
ncbi:uncharacterized protein F5147DRAFT_650905 [Suillus discolor]|uniref:Uncharacterized protein n=1 Tax=Suillus discolor TaxID=1912936 RepID=A0A9P7FC22_9AGAM|nr:uncharacterized protein F5147DRAFT_650905 [Suillus discolor]KAG2112257.1 hypothetical protein F5147DRAFT_650905 [Suillus discolor]